MDFISDKYKNVLRDLHANDKWGADGHKSADIVLEFLSRIKAQNILDYGCGRGTLKKELKLRGYNIPVKEYDPGIVKKSSMPERVDLVVCTDVLEHIEPKLLSNVLHHIKFLANKGVYLNISCRPAKTILPNGKNAHLIIQNPEWWIDRIVAAFDLSVCEFSPNSKELKAWITI